MQVAPVHTQQDGRVARRLENRVRIVDALFALILEGTPHPTLREVAERAAVTPRTLLNHFPDTDALHAAAAARARELAKKHLPEATTDATVTERVRQWFRRAGAYYDAYSAMRWTALTAAAEPKDFDRKKHERATLSLLERRILSLLGSASVPRDAEFARAFRAAIDPITWRLLRTHQGLSRNDAAASMARTVLALFASFSAA
jgi:AcrR family transcriptional regulator